MVAKVKTKKTKNKGKGDIADLKQISPGVLVGPGYKKGSDKALDAVLDKLKINPKSLDSSGMGDRWKVKRKTKTKHRA
tara:strand:- start:126 stop:359 length:234 start_codon:yes stop_codon:yes gene_type:complete